MNTAAAIVAMLDELAPTIAAAGIWWFGVAMNRSNKHRAVRAAEDRKERADQAAQAAAQAAEDRQERADQAAQAAAQAAEDRQVTQGLLAALKSQGMVIEKLIVGTANAAPQPQQHRPPEKAG